MEHILNTETEGIDFERYSSFIDSIRDQIAPHVYAFAANPCHFDLSSRSSLHDAWLENLSISESASGERSENRRTEISMRFLGPFHDRRIHLLYTGVTRYSFSSPPHYDEPRYEHTTHGDLYTHEVRLGDEGRLIHELCFENKAQFLIECLDFTHSEEILPE